MNKFITLIALVFTFSLQAQVTTPPQAFNYSAVARNSFGQPIATSTIGIQISIRRTTALGVIVYQENHFVNTDAFGLFNLTVGGGAIISGSMSGIDWALDNYYLQVGMDANGGTNFLTMGASQLLSVPYALHAKTAESVTSGNFTETDPVFGASPAGAISNIDIINWNNKLDSFSELDPIFGGSIAAGISASDTSRWNNKLDSILETDPIFGGSIAAGISASDTSRWNNKLDSISEIDPIFSSSIAFHITSIDTANWQLDNDSTNELQTISLLNDTLSITKGNQVDLSGYKQQLSVSLTGDTLFLSNGNWVIIPGISAANSSSGGAVGNIPQNGLVAWYPFSGNANDLSGNLRNGVVNGASLTQDRFGNPNSAYLFDGVTNFILVPDTTLPNGTAPRSFSFWIKTNDTTAQSVINHGGFFPQVNFPNNIHYDFSINEDIGFGAASGGCSQYNKGASFFTAAHGATFTAPVSNGSWNHLVYVMGFNGDNSYANIRVYFNGQLISQGLSTWCGHNWGGWSFDTNAGPLVIGRPNGNVRTGFFNGAIDDIGVWDRALTDSEVQALFNAQ
jgi:hypothetical protein